MILKTLIITESKEIYDFIFESFESGKFLDFIAEDDETKVVYHHSKTVSTAQTQFIQNKGYNFVVMDFDSFEFIKWYENLQPEQNFKTFFILAHNNKLFSLIDLTAQMTEV